MALKVPILLQRDWRAFISIFWGIFAGSKRQCLPKWWEMVLVEGSSICDGLPAATQFQGPFR